MKLFRRTLRSIFLPLAALIFVVQGFAVAHEVRHDVWGTTNNCPICSVASHSTAPAPVAPVVTTAETPVLVSYAPVYAAPRLVFVAPSNQPRAPPATVL